MRIMWINPVGTDIFDTDILNILNKAKQDGTQVDVVSLPADRPKHLEYHAYEGLVIGDIVRLTRQAADKYDAIVISCFYDVGLREAREVSGRSIVTAPCQSATAIASNLGNTFSVLVGRRKWIPKMRENVHLYGHDHRLVSMRTLDLGVLDFQTDHDRTCDRLLVEGRKAIQEDGAEVIILGCTAEYGFHEMMQAELGVPVIDAILAPFKYAEFLVDLANRFGWWPSRMWGSEAPPEAEITAWNLMNS
ncbi:MAG: hydantoin racemase [Chloroflexi bacterium GWB2_49_20]|nr:MAG: hydantoin racemase [Chloroflexi bacterium GWB2_49_20]OGN79682.1 MAG: hydantoin racemase [Chloroflexi bacterium GWC2_49_37]OGN85930.1 MAG: hydantoin racemase [Chloroflexi bacterium GWD2_49_16]